MAFRQSREEQRKKQYKSGIDPNQFKTKRTETGVSVRKQKRTEQLQKRRLQIAPPESSYNPPPAAPLPDVSKIPQLVEEMRSNNLDKIYGAVVLLRKLLSLEVNPPIDQVIAAQAVPDFINILDKATEPKLQFEAAWALTNIASGTSAQTRTLIQHNAVQVFINQLVNNSDITVKEQAVWALGNIAGDSAECRDFVLARNVLQLLLNFTKEDVKTSLRRNVVWAISNLCRGKPAPAFNSVKDAIPYLALLIQSPDTLVVTDACWALSYLSDGDNDKIRALLNQGLCAPVVNLLSHELSTVQTPALRVIGNIVTGDDLQTQAAITAGCLPALKSMLDKAESKKSIKREVCWTLSNITAGTTYQIQSVIDAGIVESLIWHMIHSDFDIAKEAAWAIANATSSGEPRQIHYLVQQGCLKPLCELVRQRDVKVVAVSLEGLENILLKGEDLRKQTADQRNPYADIIEKCEGHTWIQSLRNHPNPSLREKANNLLVSHFDLDEGADQNIAPNLSSDKNSFTFGAGGFGAVSFN